MRIWSLTSGTSQSGLPKGAIILWSGNIASIPAGFAFCNGTNGTPDLRERFIICADYDNNGVASVDYVTAGSQSDLGMFNDLGISNGPDWSFYSDQASNSVIMTPYYALAYIMKL